MFSNSHSPQNVSLSPVEIEMVKPYLQMAVQTNQLDKSSVKSMLAVLKASVNSTERQMPKLLSKKELATILGLSTKSIERLVKAGKLKPHKIGKRAYRFIMQEVIEYMENGYDKEA